LPMNGASPPGPLAKNTAGPHGGVGA
jgi:hypothetical protein